LRSYYKKGYKKHNDQSEKEKETLIPIKEISESKSSRIEFRIIKRTKKKEEEQ
jgi:hypothetical protein